MLFRGTFEHTLDAKHRLTIPAKFRGALADGAVLAISPATSEGGTRAVAIWTAADYEEYARAALAQLNPLSNDARDMKRILFNNSHDVELDSANRVMIPPRFLKFAGLDKDVVITGSGECLEVWDRAAHAAYDETSIDRFSEIAARFDHTA